MENNTEVKWPEYRVIEVGNKLGAKVLVPGNPVEAIATAKKRADSAIDQLSVQFPAWMKSESDRLHQIRVELATKGYNEVRLDQLFTCSHDIKGEAHTFGYPVAGIIAKLLCDLMEHAPEGSKLPLAVIDQHVDTIRAIVRQDLKGDGNAQTSKIVQGLHILDQSTLKKMSPRPDSKAG